MTPERSKLTRAVQRAGGSSPRSSPLWPLLLVGALLVLTDVLAQPTEHQLKAAVLGNVAKFVEWPAAKGEEAVSIGIFGHDPFGNDLESVLKSVKVKGKSITIRRSGEIRNLEDCHIIFFSARETGRVKEIVRRLGKRPILTVGEDARFLEEGGAISLSTEQRKIQISINLPATEKAGLTVNPQMLALAKKVKRKEQP
jgi:hypothetical protein